MTQPAPGRGRGQRLAAEAALLGGLLDPMLELPVLPDEPMLDTPPLPAVPVVLLVPLLPMPPELPVVPVVPLLEVPEPFIPVPVLGEVVLVVPPVRVELLSAGLLQAASASAAVIAHAIWVSFEPFMSSPEMG